MTREEFKKSMLFDDKEIPIEEVSFKPYPVDTSGHAGEGMYCECFECMTRLCFHKHERKTQEDKR
jgi:hypothetical protein